MASVIIPLAQGCEELEAVTVIDLLRRAEIKVTTVSLDDHPVRASRGTLLLADKNLDQVLAEEFDMIVLPGGLPGADNLSADSRILKLVDTMANAGKYTAAICAAPKVLAKAGILDGKRATAFPGTLEPLNLGDTKIEASPIVIDGKVVTSKGPGTAMDFALTLIELLDSETRRQSVESALQRP